MLWEEFQKIWNAFTPGKDLSLAIRRKSILDLGFKWYQEVSEMCVME